MFCKQISFLQNIWSFPAYSFWYGLMMAVSKKIKRSQKNVFLKQSIEPDRVRSN
jgi:hypothetical protein